MNAARFQLALRPACGLCSLALTLSCGVDATCRAGDEYAWLNGEGASVLGPQHDGEIVLSRDNTSFITAFEVTIAGLPEVWTSDTTLNNVRLSATLTLSYVDETLGDAQLPAVQALLERERAGSGIFGGGENVAELTGIGVSSASASIRVAPFEICREFGEKNCCPVGATSCDGRAVLTLSREPDLFPEVSLSYTAEPSAQINSCLEEPQATWSIREVTP